MSEREPLDAGLKSTEAALAPLVPAAGRVDRDRLMYEAGRTSAARSPWRQMVALSAVAAVALVAGRLSVPTANQDPVAVAINESMPEPMPPQIVADLRNPESYFQLRRRLDLPEVTHASSPTATLGSADLPRGTLFHELLN